MKNPEISVPNQFLNFFSAKVPDVWKAVDYYRYMRDKEEDDWDRRVLCPSGWNAITESVLPKSSVEAQVFAANNLQVMGAWRPTQDILRFDADFTACSCQKPGSRAICRLKFWKECRPGRFYFETRGFVVEGRHYDGFSPAWTRATTGNS